MTRQRTRLGTVLLHGIFALIVVGLAIAIGSVVYRRWSDNPTANTANDSASQSRAVQDGTTPVRVGIEARKNMGLNSAAIRPTEYFRRIDVPGVITDRPGVSERGVVAPVTGIVTQIHAYPGHTVAPNSPLVSMRLVSESLHTSQLELFKATKEIEIARQQKQRLEGLANSGGVAGSRVIEIDNQIQRMDVNVQAYRQDLLARGLPPDRIDAAARGEFITEITVRAPSQQTLKLAEVALTSGTDGKQRPLPFSFELQSLKVELGQQVDAGEVLCNLADYRTLLIEGRGFRKDLAMIQRAATEQFPIEIGFELSDSSDWPPFSQQIRIEHVANLIEESSRTFPSTFRLKNK